MKKIILCCFTLALLLCLSVPCFAAEDEYSDILGTWVFNDTLTGTISGVPPIAVSVNGVEYSWFNTTSSGVLRTYSSATGYVPLYYPDNGWVDNNYRTIELLRFTKDDLSYFDDGTFLSWLKANAVKQIPVCDGSVCPAYDINNDNICDDCGLALTMSLRTLYNYNGVELPPNFVKDGVTYSILDYYKENNYQSAVILHVPSLKEYRMYTSRGLMQYTTAVIRAHTTNGGFWMSVKEDGPYWEYEDEVTFVEDETFSSFADIDENYIWSASPLISYGGDLPMGGDANFSGTVGDGSGDTGSGDTGDSDGTISITDIWNSLVNLDKKIMDGIKSIFIPDKEVIQASVNDFIDYLTVKFNFNVEFLQELFSNETPIEDIGHSIILPDYGYKFVNFIDVTHLINAVTTLRPYIRAFFVVLLALYNIRMVLSFIRQDAGVATSKADDLLK